MMCAQKHTLKQYSTYPYSMPGIKPFPRKNALSTGSSSTAISRPFMKPEKVYAVLGLPFAVDNTIEVNTFSLSSK